MVFVAIEMRNDVSGVVGAVRLGVGGGITEPGEPTAHR